MKILSFESSTACGSVAVVVDGKVLSFEQSMASRAHAEFMNPAAQRCLNAAKLKSSEIDIFACGLGPGSFTGLRVSGNIAKSFAMTFQKPLVAIDSLTLLKEGALAKNKDLGKSYLCLINAFKNMLYMAYFEGDNVLIPPTAMTLPEIHTVIAKASGPALGLGDGFAAFAEAWSIPFLKKVIRDSAYVDYPLASTLALKAEQLALQSRTMDWKSFKPLYIRTSAAEENLKLKN